MENVNTLIPPALPPAVDYSTVHNPACGVAHLSSVEGACDVRVSGTNTTATLHLRPHELVLHAGTG